jgi:CRP-like cAMP-binding protein
MSLKDPSPPLLAALEGEDRETLLALAEPLTLPAGATLFTRGDLATAAYVIVSGGLEVLSGSGAVLVTLGPGEVVGEIALIDHQPRSATAVTTTATALLCLDRETLRGRCAQGDPAAYGILRALTTHMAARIRVTNTWLATLLAAEPPETP